MQDYSRVRSLRVVQRARSMILSPAVKALKAKLQTKAKHRPHKMVMKKLPDGSGAIAVLPRRGSGRDAN